MWRMQSKLIAMDMTSLHSEVEEKLVEKDKEIAEVLETVAKLTAELQKKNSNYDHREKEFEQQIVERERGYDMLVGDLAVKDMHIEKEKLVAVDLREQIKAKE